MTARHRPRQDGATSPEFVAILLVVGGLVAAVVAIGLPPSVRATGERAVCLLFDAGASCGEVTLADGDLPSVDDDAPVAPAPPPPPACAVNFQGYSSQNHTDWLFDRNVSGRRYETTELSDGSVVILDTEWEGSGTVVGGGVELAFAELSADGSRVELEENGVMYALDGQALEDYRETMTALAVDAYVNGGSLRDLNDLLVTGDLDAYTTRQYYREMLVDQHVTHDFYRTSTALQVNFGVGVPVPKTPIVVGGSAGAGGSSSVAVAVERETGNRSITNELTLEGEVGVFVSAYVASIDSGGGGEGSASYTIDVDDQGRITNVTLNTRVRVDGQDLSAGVGVPGAPGSGLEVGAADVGDSGMLDLSFSVPVSDDPASMQVLDDFLRDPMGNLGEFGAVASEHGEVLGQVYDVDRDSDNVDLAIRALASVGIGSENVEQTNALVGAVSYDSDNGWLNRGDCS